MSSPSSRQLLSKRIFAHSTERAKARGLLCAVYHHALHGRYATARDMLLMSHLADSVHQFDIATQILYNRALVRVGICAFENQLAVDAVRRRGQGKWIGLMWACALLDEGARWVIAAERRRRGSGDDLEESSRRGADQSRRSPVAGAC